MHFLIENPNKVLILNHLQARTHLNFSPLEILQ